MIKTGLYCLTALLALMIAPCTASLPCDHAVEAISITADEASEDTQPGVLYFDGHFIMQTNDWRLESRKAVVYGPPDRPDKVYLEGSPARFLVTRYAGAGTETVEATAPEMEYLRSTGVLRLSGGATLMLENEVIRSTVIEYNINTDRYRAGGADGVMIEVPPVK